MVAGSSEIGLDHPRVEAASFKAVMRRGSGSGVAGTGPKQAPWRAILIASRNCCRERDRARAWRSKSRLSYRDAYDQG
jgi:hypothetical protein